MSTPRSSVTIKLPANAPLPPAEGANYFHFTVAGTEVQFLVGTVNLLRVHEAKITGQTTAIVPEITHRFLLSPLGFASLKSQLDEISKSAPGSDVDVTSQVSKTP